jgi:hypothetical protein
MPATYEPIATQTLASAATSITFSSIPSTYTDLKWVFVGGIEIDANALVMRFNGDTGTNYSRTFLNGNGASATSGTTASATRIQLQTVDTFSIPTFISCDIFSYAGSTFKTVLSSFSGDRNGSGNTFNLVGLWRNTSAITSITLLVLVDSLAAGTTATLYGIKAA